jgi:hypothetical protein
MVGPERGLAVANENVSHVPTALTSHGHALLVDDLKVLSP